jgi:hypothetical protein
MESTSPVTSPTRIMSPTSKVRSAIRNKPLIRFDADVWEAKPIATVRMPAAPISTAKLKPSSRNADATNRPSTP